MATRTALAAQQIDTPPSGLVKWEETKHILEAWNGTTLNLTDYSGRSGIFLTRDGVRGLGMPPLHRYTNESPAIAGESWRGQRVKARDVFWPLHVFHEGGTSDYIDWEDTLYRALAPEHTVKWRVITPRSDRYLTCRFVDDSDRQETFDVPLRGWDRYGMHLIAEDPYWKAATPVTRTWSNDPGKPFFGGAIGGFGPPFYISRSNRIEEASMPNLGDVDGWPKWTIYGPCAEFSVTVGGATTRVEHSIEAGAWVTLDSNPARRGLFDMNGQFIPGGIKAASFGAIPPGREVPISMSVDNLAASVSVEMLERFYRGRGSSNGTT